METCIPPTHSTSWFVVRNASCVNMGVQISSCSTILPSMDFTPLSMARWSAWMQPVTTRRESKFNQPITLEEESRLWELGLLGDHNAQVLLNTIVYQVGCSFALRSGNEHRRLRHKPSQIQLYEPPGGCAYLVYCEDISRTNQRGLASKKKKSKEVYQYANEKDPSRCFVRLYKLYNSKCP